MKEVSHKNTKSGNTPKGKLAKQLSRSLYISDEIWRALLIHRASTPGAKSVNQYIIEATLERMKRDGIKVAA